MRNGLIGAIAGIIAALAIGYLIWARPLGDAEGRITAADARTRKAEAEGKSALAAYIARKSRQAHITLKRKGETADCTATIPADEEHLGGYPEEDITWYILNDETDKCSENGAWAVHLEFTEADFPFDSRTFRVGQTQKKMKVKKNATQKKLFSYKVVMVEHSGNKYTLIDPDVEVEPPNVNPPPAAPPANPPANPPPAPKR
jgi:hypothetical protein